MDDRYNKPRYVSFGDRPTPMTDNNDNQHNINHSHSGSGDNVAGDSNRIQQGVVGNDNANIRIAKLEQKFEAPKSPERTGGEPPNNLGSRGIDNPEQFVGREEAIADLHEKLQGAQRVAIAGVAGMGGVGDRKSTRLNSSH